MALKSSVVTALVRVSCSLDSGTVAYSYNQMLKVLQRSVVLLNHVPFHLFHFSV